MIHNQSHFLGDKNGVQVEFDRAGDDDPNGLFILAGRCSSGLSALQVGDCQVALAGGISIGQLARGGYLYQPGMIFSPDGHCRPFDAQASGTIEGQGVGIVVLKPLAQALADGDAVYAVVKGSAVNNDGRDKMGFTAQARAVNRR